MAIFDKLRKGALNNRKADELLYSIVAQEMGEGVRHGGLWLKALELARGDKEKQVAEYIRLRVQSLRDDVAVRDDVAISTEKTVAKPDGIHNRTIEYLDIEDLDVDEFSDLLQLKSVCVEDFEEYFSGKSPNQIRRFLNAPNSIDEYPVHTLVKLGAIDLATWVLNAGANPNVKNYWGKTPLEIAGSRDDKAAITLLETYSTSLEPEKIRQRSRCSKRNFQKGGSPGWDQRHGGY